MACAALSVFLAAGSSVLASQTGDWRFWFGLLVLIAVPGYLRAAAWVDANSSWDWALSSKSAAERTEETGKGVDDPG